MADLEIIDAHTHLFRSKEHGKEIWEYAFGQRPPRAPEQPAYGTVDEVQDVLKATGVARANFLMWTFSGHYIHDSRYFLPDDAARRRQAEHTVDALIADRIRDNNEWALSAIAQHPNLSFFCGVDPRVMDEQALVAEIADKTGRGALGVKILPADLGMRGDDRRLWPIYEYCQAHEIPVLSETGSREGAVSWPIYFADALKQFPRLKLIFAHMGWNPVLGEGGDAQVAELARQYENVYGDVSLRLPPVADGQVSPEDMVAYLRRVGTDRVLYGSNWVFVEMFRTMWGGPPLTEEEQRERPTFAQTWKSVQVLKSLPLTDDEREQIASKNFKRVTGLGSRATPAAGAVAR